MMDLKEKTAEAKDPELLLMREEGREILRNFSLMEIDSLITFNEGISTQIEGNRYGWNIAEKITGDSRESSLKRIRAFLEKGQADTLEEAYALGRRGGSEKSRVPSRSF
jgi:hypothetical protein